ncbi:hypothetical protein GCM10025868_07150 [Angustibacter aerolatus]|uniref:Solute-binding protein family 3/N-terminal domain-containing protein n=1 Tax=Angustibacter aerolatus TaxID=1162965 RepID=A0ABQ6JF66_9ACTN|nr:hypothetical protein [Angustibacter aerolatus]GMA85465.1 hypothetical protein GCM10025868_07150 [Angustibacter aerolatus]
MHLRTSHLLLAGAAAAALALTGCGKEGTPAAAGGASDACAGSGVTFTPAKPDVSGSPTFDKISGAGAVKVGVKADQPNLGYKDTSGKRCGFDIEMAQARRGRPGRRPGQDPVHRDPLGEPRVGAAGRPDRLLRGHLLDHRRAQAEGLVRRPVLRGRPGPAGTRGRERDHRQGHAEGQEGLLGHRLDADPEGARRGPHRALEHRRVQDLLRVRVAGCSTRRSTR